MKKHSIEIITLSDSNSDSFLIKFLGNVRNRYILIDGGLRGNGRKSLQIVREIFNKKEVIDMVILTHVDLDHVNGLLSIFESDIVTSKNIGGVLFNVPHSEVEINSYKQSASQCGYREGNKLLELILKKNINICKAVSGGSYHIDNDVLIDIIAPTQAALDIDHFNWRNTEIGHDETEDYNKESLLKEKHVEDTKPQNVSSIVCLISFDSKALLFTGDSVPSQILNAAKEPIAVDFFKIPHHGSKYNITPELLVMFPSPLYLIPGNRASYPNFYTIALLDEKAPSSQVYVPKGSWVHNDRYENRINLCFTPYEAGTRILL